MAESGKKQKTNARTAAKIVMTTGSVSVLLLKGAMQNIQSSRLSDAEAGLLRIPGSDSLYPQSLHLLGVVRMRQGRHVEAAVLLRQAIDRGDTAPILIANLLSAAIAANTIDDELLKFTAEFLMCRLPAGAVFEATGQVLTALAYNPETPYPRVESTFRHIVLPVLRWSLGKGMYDLALELEYHTHAALVKQRETEEHFKACVATWIPDMVAEGRRVREKLPPVQPPLPGAPLKLGFFIHNQGMLAHHEALINMLRGYRQLVDQPFEPRIYCFAGHNEKMLAAFQSIDVPVIQLEDEYPETKGGRFQRFLRLRDRIAGDQVQGLVWVSVTQAMSFALSIRMAPVQIWWAMKYHGIEMDDIDEYVTSLSFARQVTINGRQWCAGRLQVSDRFDPTKTAAAENIAREFRPGTILGTLGREEKLLAPDFLSSVSRILHDNPDTVFLWTGRSEHPVVSGHFREQGLAERTKFIGWVDIKVYAQVLDIFLDSYPFGCGFTALDAMAAGKPLVLMASSVDSAPNLDQLIHPLLSGSDMDLQESAMARDIFIEPHNDTPLYQRALNNEDYVARANRLIRDPVLRQQVGNACRRFINEMMSDPSRTASDYSAYFVAALRRKGF